MRDSPPLVGAVLWWLVAVLAAAGLANGLASSSSFTRAVPGVSARLGEDDDPTQYSFLENNAALPQGCFPDMASCTQKAQEKGGKCCNGGGCIARCKYADGVCCPDAPFCCKIGYQCNKKKVNGKDATTCKKVKSSESEDQGKNGGPGSGGPGGRDSPSSDPGGSPGGDDGSGKKKKKGGGDDGGGDDDGKGGKKKGQDKNSKRAEKARKKGDREAKKALAAAEKTTTDKQLNQMDKAGANDDYAKVASIPLDGHVINIFSHVVVNAGKHGKASVHTGSRRRHRRRRQEDNEDDTPPSTEQE